MRCTIRSCAAAPGALVLTVLQLAAPSPAAAQSAWLPFDGESSVSLNFQSHDYRGHYWADGSKHEGLGPSRAMIGFFQLEYAVTDRLAVTASLPYVASKYTGSLDEPLLASINADYERIRRTNPALADRLSLDVGDYNAAFQDFVFTLRYNLMEQGLTVTPVIGATVPSHGYETIGEAAPGRHRLELLTGVNVGRLLDPFAPDAYVHARYAYSFVQPLRGIQIDRSAAEFEGGYALVPSVSIRAVVSWMKTHGGIGFNEAWDLIDEDPLLFLEHDRLLASRHWRLGGGTTVTLTDALNLDAGLQTYLAGGETRYGLSLNVGLTWRFLQARLPQPSAGSAPGQLLSRTNQRPFVNATRSR